MSQHTGRRFDSGPVPGRLSFAKGQTDSVPLAAALRYASRGWRVFPLHWIADGHCSCSWLGCSSQGKHPRIAGRGGVHAATTDPSVISRWWTTWPLANIGIACGPESGLLVLDVDVVKSGGESLRRLEQLHGPLPDGLRARTGGGYHCYFTFPAELHEQRLAENLKSFTTGTDIGGYRGLDFRGAGGYVVAPPSMHVNGRRYEWVVPAGGVHVPDPPAWLLHLILRRPPKLRRHRPLQVDVSLAAGSGTSKYGLIALTRECADLAHTRHPGRNDALNRAAYAVFQLVAGGEIAHDLAVAELLRAAQDAASAPAPEPFTDTEIMRTLQSAARAAAQSPRSAPKGSRS